MKDQATNINKNYFAFNRNIFIQFFFFLSIFYSVTAQSQKEKIWEIPSNTLLNYEEQGFKAVFQKITKYHSGYKGPKGFSAKVNNIVDTSPTRNSSNDIFLEFQGACAKQLVLKGTFDYNRNTSIDKFKQSKNTEDLPIRGVLSTLIKGLEDQCDELESIIIKLHVRQDGKPQMYTGTLKKVNNWELQNGFNSIDENYKISINTDSSKSKYQKDFGTNQLLAVNYNGSCEAKPTLHIAPVFADSESKRYYKRIEDMAAYNLVARRAAQQYAKQCPEVEQINFTLDYLPPNYKCRDGQDCTLKAIKDIRASRRGIADMWRVNESNFRYTGYQGPILSTYNDVLHHLEKKDLEPLKHYDRLFKMFYVDFLIMYGENCKELLANTVSITTTTFEQSYDPNTGIKHTGPQIGAPTTVFIDNKYLNIYKNFDRQKGLTVMSEIFFGHQNQNVLGAGDAVLYRLKAIQNLEKEVLGNCNSPRIQGIYKTMQELAATMK
ncbi:hypothetical protein [Lutibacter citreus]|uniref:hypothetical protein n=1 Tax=Lutibacter citreus TaxID=2138210 RepID=UPI000DBE342C|nr:hypothetical protein [Lutibacter citreus]